MATIRKRGSKYQVQVRKDGCKPISKSFLSRKDAEAWARKTESEIERGIFLDVTEASKTLLLTVLERYAKEVLPHKRGGNREVSRIKYLKAHLGGYSLSNLTPAIISQYRDTRLMAVSNQSAKHEISLISRILNHAIKDWGFNLPHGNPVQQVRMPKLPAGRERRLSVEEEQKLIANSSYYIKPIILFTLETGMRRGEIAAMEWPHIDFKSRTLLIPETKTDSPRRIPLSRKAVEVLMSLPRRLDGIVFSLKPDSMTQAFDRTCKKAGIQNLRFHDLRHEATSRLFEKGLNPMEVAAITGHKDMKMLKRYTHLKAERLVAKLG